MPGRAGDDTSTEARTPPGVDQPTVTLGSQATARATGPRARRPREAPDRGRPRDLVETIRTPDGHVFVIPPPGVRPGGHTIVRTRT